MERNGRSTAAAMLSLDIDEPLDSAQRPEFFQPLPFPEEGRAARPFLEGRRI